jgi:hypothetical protein
VLVGRKWIELFGAVPCKELPRDQRIPWKCKSRPQHEGGVLLLGGLNDSADGACLQPFVDLIQIVILDIVDDTRKREFQPGIAFPSPDRHLGEIEIFGQPLIANPPAARAVLPRHDQHLHC